MGVGAMMQIEFEARGIPQPKGSTKAFMRQGMRFPVVTNDNLKTKPWVETVKLMAQQHALEQMTIGPVQLWLHFTMPRPKAHYNAKGVLKASATIGHTKRPDLDKLARAVKDALKGVLYADDAQVTALTAEKAYGETPGVHVTAYLL